MSSVVLPSRIVGTGLSLKQFATKDLHIGGGLDADLHTTSSFYAENLDGDVPADDEGFVKFSIEYEHRTPFLVGCSWRAILRRGGLRCQEQYCCRERWARSVAKF